MHKIVDVSNNNGHVNFAALKAEGASGVWLKVTEGTGFVDPDYRRNRRRARAAGLRVGGYHFGHPRNHPAAEAAHFLAHLELETGDLLPALDLEVTDSQPASVVRAYAAGFFAAFDPQIDDEAMLYAGSYFIRENGLQRLRRALRRWIPSYGARPAWYRWAAWQFTDGQPRYPGAIGHLDTSRVPSLALVTYKAARHRRAAGHAKRAAYLVADGLILGVPSAVWRWWRRVHKLIEGRRRKR